MRTIIYRSRFLTWGEAWFNNEPEDKRVDCMIYLQRRSPIAGVRMKSFQTYMIDLQQSRECLMANMKSEAARKITQAREQDKIICEHRDPRERAIMDHFERFYNAFAIVKAMAPLNRQRMEGVAAAGALDLSLAKTAQGEILIYHTNYRDENYACGINSVSLFHELADSDSRKMISRSIFT